jgi:outer membrane protein TolC
MYIQTTNYLKVTLSICCLLLVSNSLRADNLDTQDKLTLNVAVQTAQKNDLWLVANQHQQDSIESLSMAADTLPDPKMSLGVANIAADSFNFDQEAMTQFKVGISQMFPRGDSSAIKRQQLKLMGSQFPYQRKNRKAKVAVAVSELWLDTFKAQESIALIEKDRALFEQLADVAQASYSSAVGKTRQQDIVRAQLELTRLDDRLTMLKQQQEMSQKKLAKWLSNYQGETELDFEQHTHFRIANRLPNTQLSQNQLMVSNENISQNILYRFFSNHPSVKSIDQKIKASHSGIKLAKQKYKPEWGVSAAYGVRDSAPNGNDRADLFSVGVSFDIPLFTSNRQDKQVESAISTTSAIKTEKWLLIRKLIAQFETSRTKLKRLNQRQALYSNRLLPQMHEQAEASLTAYTNDDGDFSEVVRSRIAELNASIDALSIDVEKQKTIIQLNYYFINNPPDSNPLVGEKQ